MMLQHPSLALPAIAHGFFGREGGVSEGVFASLNCGYGSGDALEKVHENRRRASHALSPSCAHLLSCAQVHGNRIITVDTPWDWQERPEADGMVTRTPGIALGVLAADCAPVLFADPEAGVVGAAHSGWPSTLACIARETLRAMGALGASIPAVHAVIGPCIAQASYQVGREFEEKWLAADPAHAAFFSEKDGQPHFDLRGAIAWQLRACGVREVAVMENDTYTDPQRFFSFRRTVHAGETQYGRQVSAIMIQ